MRVLFLPLVTGGSALGTISRCLSIAEILQDQGHQVLFLTGGPASKYVKDSGFQYKEAPVPKPPGRIRPMQNLADVALYLNLTDESYVKRSLDIEMEVITSFKPHVIFSEFKLTAPLSAACSGIPLISTACSCAHPGFVSPLFPDSEHIGDEANVPFNHFLVEYGLPTVTNLAELFFMRSNIKIVPSSPDLEPILHDLKNVHYVGYLLYNRWERAPLPNELLKDIAAKHIVFAYFSEGEVTPQKYMDVLPKAFDNTDFHIIVAVGWHPDLPQVPRSTQNVSFVRFVPGSSLLEECHALIFHGGQNTAMATLLHGVPSLVIPGKDFERDFNARSLVKIGAAIHMRIDEFTPHKVYQATLNLMEGEYGRKAATHGQLLKQLGGPARVAELIVRSN